MPMVKRHSTMAMMVQRKNGIGKKNRIVKKQEAGYCTLAEKHYP